MGYESMTPIQAQAIPVVLTGKDVMGAAQTGTGKTAAFSLPLLQRLLKHENSSTSPARHPVRALVLLPTRELADQVAQQVKLYAKYTNLRSAVVFGGMDMKPQTLELKKGVEVLVATPGACWTTSKPRMRCSTRWNTWCWTKPTACWTSAFCPICSAS
jgi:ATP-dependent RNA helicase RhlE